MQLQTRIPTSGLLRFVPDMSYLVLVETHQKKLFSIKKNFPQKSKKNFFSQSKKTFSQSKKTFSTSLQASLGASGDFVPIKKNFQ